MNEIKNILSSNEKVIWEGKPKFAPYFISQLTCAGCFSVIFLIGALLAAADGELGPSILLFVLGFVFIISPLISYLYYKTISVFSGLITSTGQGGSVSVPHSLIFVEDAYGVYEKLKKVSHDIKSDIEYPNDLRPKTNSGYNTGYVAKK